MPEPDPAERADLLRRILDHDATVETLQAEIRAAEAELGEKRRRIKEAIEARTRLSRDIRRPRPLLGSEKGDIE